MSSEATTLLTEREGKVAAVIKTLREALRSLDAKLYVRPLLTSYSALGDIHGALRLIKEAKEEQLAKDSGHMQGEHWWLACRPLRYQMQSGSLSCDLSFCWSLVLRLCPAQESCKLCRIVALLPHHLYC